MSNPRSGDGTGVERVIGTAVDPLIDAEIVLEEPPFVEEILVVADRVDQVGFKADAEMPVQVRPVGGSNDFFGSAHFAATKRRTSSGWVSAQALACCKVAISLVTRSGRSSARRSSTVRTRGEPELMRILGSGWKPNSATVWVANRLAMADARRALDVDRVDLAAQERRHFRRHMPGDCAGRRAAGLRGHPAPNR